MENRELTPLEIRAAEELLMKNVTKKTLEEIASEIGTTRRHLYDIRQRPHFKAYLKKRAVEMASDDLHEVMTALKKKALKGDVKAIRTLFEVADVFPHKKLEVDSKVTTINVRNDADVEAEMADIMKELQEMNVKH